MNRNSNISKDLSAHTAGRHPVPRWRSVFIALVLALIFGSAGQAPVAQAAPDGATELSFYMRALKEREGSVCKGELVAISVLVNRHNVPSWWSEDGDELANLDNKVTGVEVNGLVQNPNIGELSPNKRTTILEGAGSPGAADFMFIAKNYGETEITFRGQVVTPGWFGTNWGGGVQNVTASVHVTVSPCSYKVSTVSTWKVGMTSVGTMDGVMKSDKQGNFTGSANVNWVASTIGDGGCGAATGIAPSKADLTGKLDENGQMVGQVTFGPSSASGFAQCYVAGVSTENFFTPDPLTIRASSEGASVYTQAQAVRANNGSFTGTATIVVIPEEEEATG